MITRRFATITPIACAIGLAAWWVGSEVVRELAAQEPQEVRFDGPFRLPPPPYTLDGPQIAPAYSPAPTIPQPGLPAQPVNGPIMTPYVPAPYSSLPNSSSPYAPAPAITSPYQLAPYALPYPNLPPAQPGYPIPAYPAGPQFNAPQNGLPSQTLPSQTQPPAAAPAVNSPPNTTPPSDASPATAPLPAPAETPQPTPAAPAPAHGGPPPPEVVPPPPDAEKSTAPLLVEESVWGSWAPKVWDPWEGNVELGMNGTDGNSETFNIRLGVTAKHKTETFVQTLQFTSIQKTANNVVTANTALLDGRLEWPMPGSRWNYFIHGLAEYDEFKAFDVRLSGDTGFGYEFIQTDMTTLIGRSGIAFSHEIGGPDTTIHPELLFGGEFKHKFSATHSVSMKMDYYPNVTAFGDFRLNSQASWEIALAQAWGLSLKLSVIDRYDSTPQGARPNDLDYSTLLLWTF
jgi:putative salt-induced outer membrane protein YdiY